MQVFKSGRGKRLRERGPCLDWTRLVILVDMAAELPGPEIRSLHPGHDVGYRALTQPPIVTLVIRHNATAELLQRDEALFRSSAVRLLHMMDFAGKKKIPRIKQDRVILHFVRLDVFTSISNLCAALV